MDDRWGDILYLVFLVLLLVVGALKKKKVQKPVPPVQESDTPQSVDEKPSGFETVLETLLGEEMVKTLKEDQEQEMVTIAGEPAHVDEIKEKEKGKSETFAHTKPVQKINMLFQEEEQEDDLDRTDFSDVQETNWRDAIIYSEIINRKYN